MRNMVRSKVLSVAVAGFMMLGALVGPVSAQLITRDVNLDLPGADALGNIDFGNRGPALLRQFKYTRIRLVVEVSRGIVPNLSNRAQVYRNPGLMIQDPETNLFAPATRDTLVIGPGLFQTTNALAVYVGSRRV